MKRKFTVGFILIFLAYLGCKSSVFGFCTSAEKFVERASIPPCHQTAESEKNSADSCDCPITHEELQSSSGPDFPIWKQIKFTVWNEFTVLKPQVLLGGPSRKWLVLSSFHSPPYFPTQTVRLLI
ncbi:hypothetical protein [Leptospira brenneri]|uniref:Uncharacterized protein n=1 Tax=Leptospira brenneri TaxID=2023182 RepID=A0A2M9XX29_9LEPT|nr:hypothetical protein [Leptospira brenneri]PJZ43880.1 hypothetical protein CH361_17900 [Leptospira brenneri]TGK93036.1 hypothetical protein EHQ30_12480 [Leptospira brenneri]